MYTLKENIKINGCKVHYIYEDDMYWFKANEILKAAGLKGTGTPRPYMPIEAFNLQELKLFKINYGGYSPETWFFTFEGLKKLKSLKKQGIIRTFLDHYLRDFKLSSSQELKTESCSLISKLSDKHFIIADELLTQNKVYFNKSEEGVEVKFFPIEEIT